MIWVDQKNWYWPQSNSANRVCWTIKDIDAVNVDGTQYMFILTTSEKIKETRLKFSWGSKSYKRWHIMMKQELNWQTHN